MDGGDLGAAIAGGVGMGTALLLLRRAHENVSWLDALLYALGFGALATLLILVEPLIPDVGPLDGRGVIVGGLILVIVAGSLRPARRRHVEPGPQ